MVETQYSRFTLVSISSTSYSQLEILIVILPGLSPNDIIFGTSRPPHAIILIDVDQERVKKFIEDMSLHERIKE